MKQVLLQRGFSGKVATTIVASTRTSSNKLYASYIGRWITFAKSNCWDPFNCSVYQVLEFLQLLFDQGSGYSALNTARGALSRIILFEGSTPVGQHPDVIRFLKGVFQLRPTVPRVNYVWDVDKVLNFLKTLSPARKLSLKVLTQKTVLLLLLVSGQRPQIVKALRTDHMEVRATKFVFSITAGDVKQGRPGYSVPQIILKGYPADRRLCIYTYLTQYLKRTLLIRGKEKSLFITIKKPFKCPETPTVARWVKDILQLAGVDMKKFTPSSVRSASTSKAQLQGVTLDFIMKNAGWSRETTFTRFYQKPICPKDDFQERVLAPMEH